MILLKKGQSRRQKSEMLSCKRRTRLAHWFNNLGQFASESLSAHPIIQQNPVASGEILALLAQQQQQMQHMQQQIQQLITSGNMLQPPNPLFGGGGSFLASSGFPAPVGYSGYPPAPAAQIIINSINLSPNHGNTAFPNLATLFGAPSRSDSTFSPPMQ